MKIEYDLIDASIFDIIPNKLNHKIAFLAKDLSNKEYIFKPSWMGHYHNINEFISHYIASLVNAPITKGTFLKIDAETMRDYHNKIQLGIPHAVLPTYIPPYNEAIFFAVEYLKDATHAKTVTHLKNSLDNTKNRESFFSQFSLDQYLKNYDRHLGNHLFYKENNRTVFYLIDFDRIFYGHTDWSKLDDQLDNTDCFNIPGYNADLYNIIEDKDVKKVHDYAANILNKIDDEAITDICNIIDFVYTIGKAELVKIDTWLKYRRDIIYTACLKNEVCFKNVQQEGVFK